MISLKMKKIKNILRWFLNFLTFSIPNSKDHEKYRIIHDTVNAAKRARVSKTTDVTESFSSTGNILYLMIYKV